MHRPTQRLFKLFLLLVAGLLAQQGSAHAQDILTADSLLPGLRGTWTGSLRYRDFGSGRTVELPASIEAQSSRDGAFLIVELAVEDPGRTVRELLVLALDAEARTLTETAFSPGGIEQQARRLRDLRVDASDDWAVLTVTPVADAGRQAEERYTLRRQGGRFETITEIRYTDDAEDAEWFERNRLVLQRAVPRTDPAALLGTWRVDLRPTPNAEPSFQEFVVESVKDGEVSGSFYGTPLQSARLNRDWGTLRLAFTTEDGSGIYATSLELRGGRLHGTTHSLGRGFLSVWTADKLP